jgi:mRNA interferase RelE/StbE
VADSSPGPRAYVRLTGPAVADLHALPRKDPQIVRWALKKMLLLERDPYAGEPLLGHLIGWRKITVGDRDWRVVWRVGSDAAATVIITVSEVWAAGARSDGEVYAEMTSRVADLGSSPTTEALSSVIEMLGRHARRQDLQAAAEPAPEPPDPVPAWLQERLVRTAGLPADDVRAMTGAEAMNRWEQFMQTGE